LTRDPRKNYLAPIPDDVLSHFKGDMSFYDHQKMSFHFSSQRNHSALFLHPGLGKSLVILSLFLDRLSKREARNILIVVPKSLMINFKNEIKKFCPKLSVLVIMGNRERKTRLISSNRYKVNIINYEAFINLWRVIRRKKYSMAAFDESTKFKYHTTSIFKSLYKGTELIPIKVISTGTPYVSDTLNIRNQFYIMKGSCAFECGSIREFSRDFRYDHYAVKKVVDRYAITFTKDECLDLPPKNFIKIDCQQNDEEYSVYRSILNDFKIWIDQFEGKYIPIKHLLAQITRLRQVCIGKFTKQSSKRDMFRDIMEDFGDNQLIVWCEWTHEFNQVKEVLSEMGISFTFLKGNMRSADFESNKESFIKGDKQVLVAIMSCLTHGHTFVNCSRALYYTPPLSNEKYIQSQDRISRIGQTLKQFYYTLLSVYPDNSNELNTVEAWIYKRLLENQETLDFYMGEDSFIAKSHLNELFE